MKDKYFVFSGQVAVEVDSPTCFHRHAPPHFAGFYTVICYTFETMLLPMALAARDGGVTMQKPLVFAMFAMQTSLHSKLLS